MMTSSRIDLDNDFRIDTMFEQLQNVQYCTNCALYDIDYIIYLFETGPIPYGPYDMTDII